MAESVSSLLRPGWKPGNPSHDRSPAGLWRRLAASIIDLIIIILISVTATAYLGLSEGFRMLLTMLRQGEVMADDGTIITTWFPMPVVSFVLVVIILIPWFYYALLESSRNQATLGKMAFRIQVSDLHDGRITFARATLRHFSKFISAALLFAGFICIGYTLHQQGLHDIIAATLVWYQKDGL